MSDTKVNRPDQSDSTELSATQLRDVQQKLDELQDAGLTPEKLRSLLFHKMLDFYQVPRNHFLRESETPERLDDPSLVTRLTELGFAKRNCVSLH